MTGDILAGRELGKIHFDTIAPLHHRAIMRLTINLDDDLYAMARSHAIATKTSISKAVGDLLRRRTLAASALSSSSPGIHPLSGFPVSQSEGRPITGEDTRRAMDEDLVRPLQMMGLSPDEVEEALK